MSMHGFCYRFWDDWIESIGKWRWKTLMKNSFCANSCRGCTKASLADGISWKALFCRWIDGYEFVLSKNGTTLSLLSTSNLISTFVQDHLVCFLGGNMALGWYFKKDLTFLLDMAKDLTKTCYEMYAKQETGLSPEIAYFNTDSQLNGQTLTVRVCLWIRITIKVSFLQLVG